MLYLMLCTNFRSETLILTQNKDKKMHLFYKMRSFGKNNTWSIVQDL